MKKTTTSLEHLKSILALPFMVLIVVPTIIYFSTANWSFNPISNLNNSVVFIFGLILLLLGFFLLIKSIILFVKIGNGTLAPWNPTRNIVVKGLYRHFRNPMISGVVLILFAESFLLISMAILFLAVFFFIANHVYFILKEEPDLVIRFEDEYIEYKKNVPRWIPRLKGWYPEND